jgi:glycosyltransferase involved in cell wall biosynthesis
LKIIHFTRDDSGGAGLAVYRLHQNLLRNNIKSLMVVDNKNLSDSSILQIRGRYRLHHKILDKIQRKFIILNKEFCFYDYGRSSLNHYLDVVSKLPFAPDIIILHWISGYVSLNVIQNLKNKYNAKVFWYPLDMGPITGGCHYAWDCLGYTNGCNDCPAIKRPFKSLARVNLKRKTLSLKRLDIQFLAGTSNIYNEIRASYVFKNSIIHKVHIGVDSDVFSPDSKQALKLKKRLGLSFEKKILFFGAFDLDEKRKGSQLLISALEILSEDKSFLNDKILLITAGKQGCLEFYDKLPFEHHHLGYVKGESKLSEIYRIADIFISPSIEDSGPMMINESILSGTPVISFNIGVAKDLVYSDTTGKNVSKVDPISLASSIKDLCNLSKKEFYRISRNCRKLGLDKVSYSAQIKRLKEIFSD